ncbi:hypothetical protein [Endozoicomonas ascidiicola]|uniref:hypothetical protein n=1 Tax=Endozoicomonas ascidiicola TaxID=1698521 RepID=UPI00082FDE07|nr:hypothetical protein [Endozoicomonas ascidiicola]
MLTRDVIGGLASSNTQTSWSHKDENVETNKPASSSSSFNFKTVHAETHSNSTINSTTGHHIDQLDTQGLHNREAALSPTYTSIFIKTDSDSEANKPSTATDKVVRNSKSDQNIPSQSSSLLLSSSIDSTDKANILDDDTIKTLKTQHGRQIDTINLDAFVRKLVTTTQQIFSTNSGVDHEKLITKLSSGQMNDLIRHLTQQYSIDQKTLKISKFTEGFINPKRITFTDKSLRETISDINPAMISITVFITAVVIGSAVIDILQDDDPSNLYFQRSGAAGIVGTLLFGYFSAFTNKAPREAYKAVIDNIDTKLIKGETVTLNSVLETYVRDKTCKSI